MDLGLPAQGPSGHLLGACLLSKGAGGWEVVFPVWLNTDVESWLGGQAAGELQQDCLCRFILPQESLLLL